MFVFNHRLSPSSPTVFYRACQNNPLGKIRYLWNCCRFFRQIYNIYRGRLQPHILPILLQYLVAFKNYNYLNLNMHFFKVNKSLNCYSDIKITLEKRNGHRICQIWIRWIITCGAQCWDAIRNTCQNRPTLPNRRLPCCRYRTICCRSSLIRQSCHFERDFDRVLLQLVDILNIRFKYREGSWHLSLKRLNWWRKVVQTLICYYWIFRTGLLFTCKSEF